jgi:hypothetical protein
MKTYEWVEVQLHSLDSALDRSEWSASLSGRFIPWETASITNLLEGCVGPRACLDEVA